MVYECEECGAALPAGVLACPKCGKGFDEGVPPDAETPARGWQPKSEAAVSSPTDLQSEIRNPATPKIVISGEHHPKPPNLIMPIHRQPRKQLTPPEAKKNRKTIIWLVLLVSFLIFGIIQDITGGKGFGSESSSQSNSANTTPEPLDSEAQKNLDAENAQQAAVGQPLTGIGEVGHLKTPGADATDPAIHVGASKKGLDDLMNTSLEKDDVGFQQVFDRGDAYTVSAGTQAKLLEFDGTLDSVAHVRIIGGTHDTEEAWVPSEWIRKN